MKKEEENFLFYNTRIKNWLFEISNSMNIQCYHFLHLLNMDIADPNYFYFSKRGNIIRKEQKTRIKYLVK